MSATLGLEKEVLQTSPEKGVTIANLKVQSWTSPHMGSVVTLYANQGKEGFYARLGFKRMNTAMAIFQDQDRAMKVGIVSEND